MRNIRTKLSWDKLEEYLWFKCAPRVNIYDNLKLGITTIGFVSMIRKQIEKDEVNERI